MNMISTGSFLTEMDASNKQETLAKKFASVWEKKNSKAARAGGVSLMALSLAACGSSDDTTSGDSSTDTTTTPVAQTYTLTAGIDTVVGGAANDTINAGLNASSTQTLQGLDSVDGGAGTDTMNVVLNTAGTYAPTLSNLEVLNLTSSANVTLDLVGATSVDAIKSVGSSGTVTVNNIASASASMTVQSTDQNHTFDIANSAVSGSADAATVTVSGVTGGTIAMDTSVESLTIASSGSTNTLAGVTSGANTFTITGAQDITITAANTTSETIDATAATGDVTITTNNANATSVTMGAGDDSVTVTGGSAVVETINMGAGDDTLTFTASLDDVDVLNGGDGTDTLAGINADVVALTSTTTTSNVSNFEVIKITDALSDNLDVSDVQEDGITTVTLANGSTGASLITDDAFSITGEAGSLTVNLGKSLAGNVADLDDTLTVVDTGTATDDSVTFNVLSKNSTTGNSVNALGGQSLTSTGYENVTLNTGSGISNVEQTTATITITPDVITADVSLTVTGGNALDIATAVSSTSTGKLTIDASGMTAQAAGTTTFDVASVSLGTAATVTATGSEGDDNFGASGAALGNFASTINAGGGDDAIYTGTAIDTVNGGAGDDTIDVSSGAGDAVDGGAGDDRVIISADANLTATDTYAGGEGTDTLAFTAQITDAASTFSAFSGFEVFEVAPGAADTFTMSNFINNQTFTRVNFGDAGGNTITLDNASASVTTVRVLSGAAGDTLAFDRLVDTTTNSLTVDLRGGGITTLLTANDEETITISGNSASDDTVITTLTAGDLTTLVITGAADVTTTNNITSTVLASVDASAATGAVDLDAGNSVVAITATGGSGGFTFEGGSGNDTITGGLGVDVLMGNAGTDTISGGAGADDITGGDGADTLTGGAGLDAFFYAAGTVASHGGDTITDFVAAQGDEISIDIATPGAAAGTADGIVKVDANGEAAGSITNADLVVIEDAIVVDVSGNAAADLAAINAILSDGGDDEVAADAEFIVILNADTDGDGSADAIQAYYMHETGGAQGQADVATLIATFSNLAGTADLTDVFTATNAEFL